MFVLNTLSEECDGVRLEYLRLIHMLLIEYCNQREEKYRSFRLRKKGAELPAFSLASEPFKHTTISIATGVG